MNRILRSLFAGAAIAAALTGGGCSSVGVGVRDRDILSRPEMRFEFRANDQVLDDHIYFSKEAASGGRGLGGGGCGCN